MRLAKNDEIDIELGENLLVLLRDGDDYINGLDLLEHEIDEELALAEQAVVHAREKHRRQRVLIRKVRTGSLEERRLVGAWMKLRGYDQLRPEMELFVSGALKALMTREVKRKNGREASA